MFIRIYQIIKFISLTTNIKNQRFFQPNNVKELIICCTFQKVIEMLFKHASRPISEYILHNLHFKLAFLMRAIKTHTQSY